MLLFENLYSLYNGSRATGNSLLESEKSPPPVQRKIPENSRCLKRLIVHGYQRHLSLKTVLFYSLCKNLYIRLIVCFVACIQRPQNVTVPRRGVQHRHLQRFVR